ncbi:hypothetical protein BVY04_00505, partial [bacterium M21]
SPADAIAKATAFLRDYNLPWVVDMDLSKCFDTLDHELILRSLQQAGFLRRDRRPVSSDKGRCSPCPYLQSA